MTEIARWKVKAPSREISNETSKMIWAVSAGRCEFSGCNRVLHKHNVTGERGNFSEKAHIYAFSRGGRRNNEELRKNGKINDIDNLMLICPICHTLIDGPEGEKTYTGEILIKMKKEHEERIERLTGIGPCKETRVVIFTAKIGDNNIEIDDSIANSAVTPEYYPDKDNPSRISANIELTDDKKRYWETLSDHLEVKFKNLEPDIQNKHISLFAIAPQPLLFKIGTLFNRNLQVDVRQTQESIKDWSWKSESDEVTICPIFPEKNFQGPTVVLFVNITCELSLEEINEIADNRPVYRITVDSPNPKCIKNKKTIENFIEVYRKMLNTIRENNSNCEIHLFPIAPASISVEMGRHWMEKGDPPITVYDRNPKCNGFHPTLRFGG